MKAYIGHVTLDGSEWVPIAADHARTECLTKTFERFVAATDGDTYSLHNGQISVCERDLDEGVVEKIEAAILGAIEKHQMEQMERSSG